MGHNLLPSRTNQRRPQHPRTSKFAISESQLFGQFLALCGTGEDDVGGGGGGGGELSELGVESL